MGHTSTIWQYMSCQWHVMYDSHIMTDTSHDTRHYIYMSCQCFVMSDVSGQWRIMGCDTSWQWHVITVTCHYSKASWQKRLTTCDMTVTHRESEAISVNLTRHDSDTSWQWSIMTWQCCIMSMMHHARHVMTVTYRDSGVTWQWHVVTVTHHEWHIMSVMSCDSDTLWVTRHVHHSDASWHLHITSGVSLRAHNVRDTLREGFIMTVMLSRE